MNGLVSIDGDVPASDVAALVGWFHTRDLPASWLTVRPAPALTAALIAAGANPERSGWWMGRPLLAEPGRADPAGVDIRRVTDGDDLDAWLSVAMTCGWIDDADDREARRRLYLGVGLDDVRLRHWIGRLDGVPIAMATSWVDVDTVDLCNLAVVDAFRGRGIGRALVSHRVRDAVQSGVTNAVLAPSPDGARLYGQLGYDTVAVIPDTCFYLPRRREAR